MAWNEPGGGGDRDPWSGKGGGDQGPPDLDEVVRKLQDRLGGLFGQGKRGGGGGDRPRAGGGAPKSIGALILVALVVLAGFKSFYVIDPAERGVVLRFGAFSEVTEPGPHLLIPLVDEVIKVNVDQISRLSHRAEMLTSDENIVDVALKVQFRIQDAADYLFQDAAPEKTIADTIESALREVIGKNKLDEILTENRSLIADSIQSGAQKMLNEYRTGLEITSVNIQDASPPEAVKEAFDDANKAREDKVRQVNQGQAYANDVVPRARGAAARRIEDAKAYKAKVVSEAKGEANRFKSVLAQYEKAPEVTRQRLYLETTEQVLGNTSKVILDVDGGNNLTYLPLDRIIQQRGAGTAPSFDNVTINQSGGAPASADPREFSRSRRVR